ncbi:YoaK family protein [Pararhizobium arenae]|uniref:YoaK family protein n=1 Tax=Pararhizobium arenae TaxID=1856850 RepID=UPI00094B628A|nr:YoaK family protein [Pararhizobium arenae]
MTRMRRRGIIRRRRFSIGLAIVAGTSVLAGMTDAIGLLMAGSFVSFMSGNTTRAAIAVAEGNIDYALLLLGAIAMFIAGNALGIIVAHNASRRAFAVTATVALLLAAAAVLGETDYATPQLYLTVLAMGAINAAAEHVEGLPIGLTYVTGALSRFGRALGYWLLGDPRSGWGLQIVPWIGMGVGALAGAVMQQTWGAASLWVAFLWASMLSLAIWFVPPHIQKRFAQAVSPHRRKAAS